MNLARKMKRSNARKGFAKAVQPPPPAATIDAIFCDCLDTLFGHDFDKDELLISYLNAQSRNGNDVVVFSTNLMQPFKDTTILNKVRDIGLDRAIIRSLAYKSDFQREVLAVLIDDEPTIKAAKTWKPDDPVFRKQMQDYLNAQGTQPEPQP